MSDKDHPPAGLSTELVQNAFLAQNLEQIQHLRKLEKGHEAAGRWCNNDARMRRWGIPYPKPKKDEFFRIIDKRIEEIKRKRYEVITETTKEGFKLTRIKLPLKKKIKKEQIKNVLLEQFPASEYKNIYVSVKTQSEYDKTNNMFAIGTIINNDPDAVTNTIENDAHNIYQRYENIENNINPDNDLTDEEAFNKWWTEEIRGRAMETIDKINKGEFYIYIVIHNNKVKKQKIKAQRNPYLNCVINCIIECFNNEKELRDNFPQYFNGKNIPISNNKINTICKTLNIKMQCFSKLGQINGNYWKFFNKNSSSKRLIRCLIYNNHCVPLSSTSAADNIEYSQHPYLTINNECYDIANNCHLINVKCFEDDGNTSYEDLYGKYADLSYYCKFFHTDGKITIRKNYKPSSTTGNIDDDYNPEYFECTSHAALLFKKWIKENDIQPIRVKPIEEILINCSDCYGIYRFVDKIDKNREVFEVDHNRSYSVKTCKTNPYYRGFPKCNLQLFKHDSSKELPDNCTFILVRDIIFNSKYNYIKGDYKMLIRPKYEYLIKIGCIIEIDYIICSSLTDLTDLPTIYGMDELDTLNKISQNSIIGMLITNGKNKEKKIRIGDLEPNELQEIIYECNLYNIKYCIEDNKTVIVKIHSNNSQYWHIHTYITQYSQIAILMQMHKMRDCELIGGCVDSILFYKNNTYKHDNPQFKGPKEVSIKKIKYYNLIHKVTPKIPEFKKYEITNEDFKRHIKFYDSVLNADKSRLICIGAAGYGKSFYCINQSSAEFQDIILNYTIELKKENKLRNDNSITVKKFEIDYILAKKKPKYNRIIIDEYTLIHDAILKRIMHYCDQYHINLLLIGDYIQLPGVFAEEEIPININDLKQNHNFDIHIMERSELFRQCNDIEYANWLDSLRWNYTERMPRKITRRYYEGIKNIGKLSYRKYLTKTETVIICSNHKIINEINQELRALFKVIPCKRVKGRQELINEVVTLDVNDSRINWNRMEYDDERTHEFEPCYCITTLASQGKTLHQNNIIIIIDSIKNQSELYVAFSRAKDSKQIKILNWSNRKLIVNQS